MQLYKFQTLWSLRRNGKIISNMFNKESANCHSGFKKTPSPTGVVGDDTNPLIRMLPRQIHKLYLRPELNQGENHPPKCWSIALLRITVGPEVYRNMSFIHHIIGWYTTSSVGLDRKTVLTLLSTSAVFRNSGLVLNDLNSSKADVIW